MNYELLAFVNEGTLRTAAADCIVVGVHGRQLEAVASMLDNLCTNRLSEALEWGELQEKPGSTLVIHTAGSMGPRRILLAQLGEKDGCDAKRYAQAASAAAKALKAARCARVLWCLDPQLSDLLALEQSVLALQEVDYRFDKFKSAPDVSQSKFQSVQLLVADGQESAAGGVLVRAYATSRGVNLCRDLGNTPPNVCTPQYLAETALTFASAESVEVEVLERDQIQALGMNAFLSVAQGSAQAPKLIVIKYQAGPADQAPVVLVGKGITFDSGGISIKPGEAMDEMKYDMCGAASVLGTLQAVIEMRLPLNVYGVIPTCENMPGGTALKPGDIITSMLGKTIEVLNTDAEGRLILCDALTYVERFKPSTVIDIATLTGACVIALGNVHSGLFAREEQVAQDLLKAASASNDSVWRMPLDEAYQDALKSNFADLQNIGGRPGGSITAARFLENFTRNYAWAHLDIAGTAWKSGADKGATGRPVKLLTQYLINGCATTL